MLATALLVFLAALIPVQDDETVKDFKKFFRKSKDPVERVELILSLEDIESSAVTKVMLPILKGKSEAEAQAGEQRERVGVLRPGATRNIQSLIQRIDSDTEGSRDNSAAVDELLGAPTEVELEALGAVEGAGPEALDGVVSAADVLEGSGEGEAQDDEGEQEAAAPAPAVNRRAPVREEEDDDGLIY